MLHRTMDCAPMSGFEADDPDWRASWWLSLRSCSSTGVAFGDLLGRPLSSHMSLLDMSS
jgi:hypothetical protein